MGPKNILFIAIVASLLLGSVFSGCVQQPGPFTGVIFIPAVTAGDTTDPKYGLASFYTAPELEINTSISEYSLPLQNSDVYNINSINSVFSLSSVQQNVLLKNGFVVLNYWTAEDDITAPYTYIKEQEIPIFISTDTLLHLYHILYDQTLKSIEEREFFDMILDFTYVLFEQSQEDYMFYTDPLLKEASRRNVGYFAVALSLLQTPTSDYNGSENIRTIEFTVPSYVADEVTQELTYIYGHNGFHSSPLFIYDDDYSQYEPRGHYTQSEKLKRYFNTMIWYGRTSFLLKGGSPNCSTCDFLISEKDALIQTIQACLLSTALPNLTIDDTTLDSLWTRIYSVTSFFVGTADDLTPYEYLTTIRSVFGSSFNATLLTDEQLMFDLKVHLALLRNPQIYGGTGQIGIIKQPGEPYTVQDLYELLEKTKGMRLLGQRFIPDSYIFQQLVFPAVDPYLGSGTPFTSGSDLGALPGRFFPRGLDVMAVLGSKRAMDILEAEGDTDYGNYAAQITNLTNLFSNMNITEWNRNLYFSWLYTLTPLLSSFDSNYPSFMQTSAWQDKNLQTTLSSWVELRHDTILYAKQSYTPVLTSNGGNPYDKPVVGYVEPVPEFYVRLLALTQMTRNGLTAMDILNQTEITRFTNLETIISRLLSITQDELEGKELTEESYQFIRNFGEELDTVITGVNDRGKETTLIADVHTDLNTQHVLEEAVGYVDLIVVAYQVPDGRIICGAGPVFSYYEFKQPLANRLTDEEWKNMLENNMAPAPPSWTQSFHP